MEVVEFMKKLYVMCKHFSGHCCDCPLYNSNFPCESIRPVFIEIDLPKVIDTVNIWFANKYNEK